VGVRDGELDGCPLGTLVVGTPVVGTLDGCPLGTLVVGAGTGG
jgi:hypothetical protein